MHLDDVAQEEAGHVEVVDGHVAEDAAGNLHVLGWGSGGVARDDEQVLQIANLSLFKLGVNRGEGRVEAAVEAEHNGHGHGAQLVTGGLDVLHVQSDRLLAQHGLAGLGGCEQVGDVQRRGRADDDGVDPLVGEDRVHVGCVAGTVDLGQLLRGITERIGNEGEGGAGVCGDGLGVDVADAAGADNGNVEHLCFFLGEGVLESRKTVTGGGPTRDVWGHRVDHGAGIMTSRTRASRSASACRKPRSVRTVAPKVSNSSGVMPSGS